MRQEDRIGGGFADMQAIDLALELSSEVVATVGACRRGRKGDRGDETEAGGKAGARACHFRDLQAENDPAG
jgi:hypothetical protein